MPSEQTPLISIIIISIFREMSGSYQFQSCILISFVVQGSNQPIIYSITNSKTNERSQIIGGNEQVKDATKYKRMVINTTKEGKNITKAKTRNKTDVARISTR